MQKRLDEFSDPVDRTTEEFTKTVRFQLRRPTERKRERLDRALESAAAIQAEAARRIPSVPRERWGKARPAGSTWWVWAKQIDPHLPTDTVHENIQRVREAFASWQSKGYDGDRPAVERFAEGNRCAFYYKHPKYKRHDGAYYISLPLAAGRGERELLPLRDGDYLREYADDIIEGGLNKGRGELIRDDDGQYWLHQAVRTDVEVIESPTTWVGVDLGLTNLAAAAAVGEGTKTATSPWSGAQAAEIRNRFAERKSAAQSDAEYEELNDAESRYIESECHRISREIVDWALEFDGVGIVLEDLTDIRDTFLWREREHTPAERRALHSWPFRQLQDMIEYKALECGIPTRYANPEYTSQTCNVCGFTDESNRDGVHFACQECGYELNADINAAFNLCTGIC